MYAYTSTQIIITTFWKLFFFNCILSNTVSFISPLNSKNYNLLLISKLNNKFGKFYFQFFENSLYTILVLKDVDAHFSSMGLISFYLTSTLRTTIKLLLNNHFLQTFPSPNYVIYLLTIFIFCMLNQRILNLFA